MYGIVMLTTWYNWLALRKQRPIMQPSLNLNQFQLIWRYNVSLLAKHSIKFYH